MIGNFNVKPEVGILSGGICWFWKNLLQVRTYHIERIKVSKPGWETPVKLYAGKKLSFVMSHIYQPDIISGCCGFKRFRGTGLVVDTWEFWDWRWEKLRPFPIMLTWDIVLYHCHSRFTRSTWEVVLLFIVVLHPILVLWCVSVYPKKKYNPTKDSYFLFETHICVFLEHLSYCHHCQVLARKTKGFSTKVDKAGQWAAHWASKQKLCPEWRVKSVQLLFSFRKNTGCVIGFNGIGIGMYSWRKKSCTSWYRKCHIICKVLYIPGGCLGCLPSTVSPGWCPDG